jgi:bd-type cytochrome oxidase subunit I
MPVVIPFLAFRLMVGMGLIMLAVSWLGVWLRWRGELDNTRWFLWAAFLSFPTGFVAVFAADTFLRGRPLFPKPPHFRALPPPRLSRRIDPLEGWSLWPVRGENLSY